MKILNAADAKSSMGGPSFTIKNRLYRVCWNACWLLLARWTPPPFHAWRRLILRLFGGNVGRGSRIYGSAQIWYPPNLKIGENVILGPRVICYNQGFISIGDGSVISQGAHLCASSHDISDPNFQLITRPIAIGSRVWIAADAFVGPGVTVETGAVLGACAALFCNAEEWAVYRGNPAVLIKKRIPLSPIDDHGSA